MKSKIDEVIDNLSKLLDDSFEEWSGGRRLETSCIATYDSAEAIDYAQFAIKELLEQLRPYVELGELYYNHQTQNYPLIDYDIDIIIKKRDELIQQIKEQKQ